MQQPKAYPKLNLMDQKIPLAVPNEILYIDYSDDEIDATHTSSPTLTLGMLPT